MSDVSTALVYTRAAEHLVVAVIGAFAIFLGYRLFLDVPMYPPVGEAKVTFDTTTIYLSHVGPGVFFALFGAGLIGFSVSRTVKYQGKREHSDEGMIFEERYRGMMEGAGSPASPQQGAVPREPVIRTLAEMAAELRAKGVAQPKKEIALREARVCLMRQMWKKEWGEFSDFRSWVYEEAEGDTPSPRINQAVAVYRGLA